MRTQPKTLAEEEDLWRQGEGLSLLVKSDLSTQAVLDREWGAMGLEGRKQQGLLRKAAPSGSWLLSETYIWPYPS